MKEDQKKETTQQVSLLKLTQPYAKLKLTEGVTTSIDGSKLITLNNPS